MADPAKMQPTGADVESFIEAIPNANRRADARALCGLLSEITEEPAALWGASIVGFGSYPLPLRERTRRQRAASELRTPGCALGRVPDRRVRRQTRAATWAPRASQDRQELPLHQAPVRHRPRCPPRGHRPVSESPSRPGSSKRRLKSQPNAATSAATGDELQPRSNSRSQHEDLAARAPWRGNADETHTRRARPHAVASLRLTSGVSGQTRDVSPNGDEPK